MIRVYLFEQRIRVEIGDGRAQRALCRVDLDLNAARFVHQELGWIIKKIEPQRDRFRKKAAP